VTAETRAAASGTEIHTIDIYVPRVSILFTVFLAKIVSARHNRVALDLEKEPAQATAPWIHHSNAAVGMYIPAAFPVEMRVAMVR
jgi:hypothetical protein